MALTLAFVLSDGGAGAEPQAAAVAADTATAVEAAPLPRSLAVHAAELVVRQGPSGSSRRRGVALRGTRLPALEASTGPGCGKTWYRVFDRAWVCGDKAVPSDEEPWGSRLPALAPGDLTPWPYAFVRAETLEYRFASGGLQEARELVPGFGFGVAGFTEIGGRRFLRTASGGLVPAGAAGISGRVSTFEGVALEAGKPWPVGWVNSRKAFAWKEPSRQKRNRLGPVQRYDLFEVLETRGQGRGRFHRFDEGAWLWSGDVRVARPAERPAAVEPDERWIDVDLVQQVITAYEGDTPVYAALVSTGRGGASRTPRGEWRIWAKVAAIPMDNTDEEVEVPETDGFSADAGAAEDRHVYSLHDVPWTQFFHEGFALHGVYWHDRFGNRRSHGCVNLAPRDARWFHDWTSPALPDGWWAIHALPEDRPTLVRVR